MVRVEPWFQGPTGTGQGGWTAHRFATRLDSVTSDPVTIALRRPVPLETDMTIVEAADAWHLCDPAEPDAPIMIATRWSPVWATTAPVSLSDAEAAGRRFALRDNHPLPHCFSCGVGADSMHIQSGPLGDGRYASTWTVPEWASDTEGTVDAGAFWAAIDCTQGWYAGLAGGRRHSVTVQIAAEILEPLDAGATYALVAWNGDYPDRYEGRKRGTCGAAFDADGQCVAVSRAFWVAVPEPI